MEVFFIWRAHTSFVIWPKLSPIILAMLICGINHLFFACFLAYNFEHFSMTKKNVCKASNDLTLQVAFDKIGSMTTNTISKQRKKQEPAVMAELDQRFRRLNSIKVDDK